MCCVITLIDFFSSVSKQKMNWKSKTDDLELKNNIIMYMLCVFCLAFYENIEWR